MTYGLQKETQKTRKRSRIDKRNCEAEERISQCALTPMHSLAESRLLRRQSSVIAYIIADYLTQTVDKKVIRDRRVIRPCMKELYYFRLTCKILQAPLSQPSEKRTQEFRN